MENKEYSSDMPVDEQNFDRFSRWGFAERIGQVISMRSDPNSIIISLYGEWGSGKTSVLNFIEKSLVSDKKVICITFNPWRFGTEDELLLGFFSDIAEALDAKLVRKKDQFKKLAKKIAPGAAAFWGLGGLAQAMGTYISIPTIEEFKERVAKELDSAKKRVLILIDDIDRLEKKEIHALFRLVKLTADFRNTAYILAFDRNVVAASLQESYASTSGNAGEQFLEKIIQIPLDLPAISEQELRKFCFEGIDNALRITNISLAPHQVQEFHRGYFKAFDDCIATPRKATLYGNVLMFSLQIMQGEVNPIDLMFIEGIRIFCPSLHKLIKENKYMFSRESKNHSNQDEKESIKKSIDLALSTGTIINKDGFINLLQDMFPRLQSVYNNVDFAYDSDEKWYEEKRICSPDYFYRYFTFSISTGDIPDKEIDHLFDDMEKWEKAFPIESNPLTKLLNESTAETLTIKLYKKSGKLNSDKSIALAIALAQKSHLFPNPEIQNKWGTPLCRAAILVSVLIQNLEKEARVQLAKNCLDWATTIEFKLEIFRWLKREKDNQPDENAFSASSIDEIGKHLGKILVQLLEENDDITKLAPKCVPEIFYWLNQFTGNRYANEYVTQLVANKPDSLIRILDSYVPIAWGIESGISRKSDFEREQYEALAKSIDVLIIFDAIQKNFPEAIVEYDRFPIAHDDNADKRFLLVQQFVWLYQNTDRDDEHEN